MALFYQKVAWLMRNAGGSMKENLAYYVENPGDLPSDLWEWIKENKLTCLAIVGGVLVIVVPLAIGFGPGGILAGSIAAGWQAGIGSVVAGSLFAILQSLAMTGVFTGIGVGLIAAGVVGAGIKRHISSVGGWFSSIFGSTGSIGGSAFRGLNGR